MKTIAIIVLFAALSIPSFAQSGGGDQLKTRTRLQDPENCGGKIRDRDRIHLQINKNTPSYQKQFMMQKQSKVDEGYANKKRNRKSK